MSRFSAVSGRTTLYEKVNAVYTARIRDGAMSRMTASATGSECGGRRGLGDFAGASRFVARPRRLRAGRATSIKGRTRRDFKS